MKSPEDLILEDGLYHIAKRGRTNRKLTQVTSIKYNHNNQFHSVVSAHDIYIGIGLISCIGLISYVSIEQRLDDLTSKGEVFNGQVP